MVQPNRPGKSPLPFLTAWERKLAFAIARKFELFEPEELQAELNRTTIDLKTRPPPAVRSWQAYLAKALHNRADTWSRRRRTIAKKERGLEFGDDTWDSFAAQDEDTDLRLAFSQLWHELNPGLKKFWHLLAQEQGNQAEVARRLGKHRNTIRTWIQTIQDLLARHQLSIQQKPSRKITTRVRPHLGRSVVISGRMLQKLIRTRLSGTQVRILLWVLLATLRRKQKTIRFSWSHLAKDLRLDRGGVARAAKKLARMQWLFIQSGRIGLNRN